MELVNITKSFGPLDVIKDFSLHIPKGEVVCLLGPSGCGKSTLLKIISGLDKNFRGQLKGFDSKRISYVFQESRLIPWLTVRENLLFVLEGQIAPNTLEDHIETFLRRVGLLDFKDSYPNTLSGGMKQRVSLARAFSMPHDVLLLDEPFQGLNVELKDQLMGLLEALIAQDKKTVILVTHDLEEAHRLGDTVIRLTGSPISGYEIIQA